MKKKDLWVYGLFAVIIFVGWSCETNDQELGTDLLPAGDNVYLHHDTIFEINSYPVSGQPVFTHETGDGSRLLLLGATRDTIVGSSKASVVTQFNTTSSYKNGPDLAIDSLVLYLYMDEYTGDTTEWITVRVHEMTERIYRDTVYYSDYEVEGKYDPAPLAERSFLPKSNTIHAFQIEDEAYLEKFYELETDTLAFRNDSVFKGHFKGFYIEAESESDQGVMAGLHLNNSGSRLAIKYASDSTEVDTTEGRDFVWTNFTIDQYSSQKINVFEHDHSGTHLAGIIDREDADPSYCYVQGMAGVNTRLSFTKLQEWIDRGKIVISSATLIFDVVPEEESGLPTGVLPERLILLTELGEGEYEPLYDYISLRQVDTKRFGGILDAESESMFSDTTYSYRFNVTLHFQAMVNEEKPDNRFILQVYDAMENPRFVKIRSNHPANPKRLRLEVVYLKL